MTDEFYFKMPVHFPEVLQDPREEGMLRLEGQIQHDFEQIIDDRYNRNVLILASQLPIKD